MQISFWSTGRERRIRKVLVARHQELLVETLLLGTESHRDTARASLPRRRQLGHQSLGRLSGAIERRQIHFTEEGK